MFSLRGFFTINTGELTSRKIFLDVVIVRVVLRSLATVEDDIGNLKETSLNESIAAAPLLVLDCSSLAQADRYSSNGCFSRKRSRIAVYLEMIVPLVLSWVKQTNFSIGFRIDSTDTSPFTEIAGATGESAIEFGISAASGIGV
jgi:hypothetical protein